MIKAASFACAILAALASSTPAHAVEKQPANKERLSYDIVVTAPGTKNQGWHGTLYDENGTPIAVETGQTVMTEIGELQSVARESPWKPHGMISTAQEIVNEIMPDAWSYKFYKTGVGTRCPSWRGELKRGDAVLKPQGGEPTMTPMGPFVWIEKPHGWVHKSWKIKVVRCD
jgi:hypothetical protein